MSMKCDLSRPSILVIRHGETQWNVAGRKQGRADSPLTAGGRRQMLEIGKDLKFAGFIDNNSTIVASPLGRTRRSAELLCEGAGIDFDGIALEPRLMEADHGDCEGLTESEIRQRFPVEYERRSQDRWHTAFPGGESYADVETRVSGWLGSLSGGGPVVAITHAMTSKALRKAYLQCTVDEIDTLTHEHGTYYKLDYGCAQRYCI